ncbi:MAG: acyl carrier protein [Alphaproteobacteria bacterium]|nr:acyl carrier protein [Alphaproteobacteria bacterium]MDE2013934.1 acyl carrier protein [Alphaproteobacteria bacterium]MDE2072469.1 acyl carrier protein [Alphaproteobacteria bacterium]MDE2351642.1 acyl carrier protein [Alphaproteobacteria bacterium]
MSEDDIRAAVIAELGNIAPEADAATINPESDLREELDIDSLDFLNFVTALHKKLGVNVPESDYPRLLTVKGAIAYLAAKLGSARA